jgi:hypothetical protein
MAIVIRSSSSSVLSVSDFLTKCTFCKQSGLSALELFSRHPTRPKIGEVKEYKIEHNVSLLSLNALNNIDCPLCRMILSRLPETRLLRVTVQTKPAKLVIRDRLHVPGVLTQDWHISILSEGRNCGCLRLVLSTCIAFVVMTI